MEFTITWTGITEAGNVPNTLPHQPAILELFTRYITFYETTKDVLDKREQVTVRAYSVKYKRLEEFLVEKKITEISAVEFKVTVARSYFNWLYDRGYAHNYCLKVVQAVKAVLKYAATHEIISYNPLSALKIKQILPNDVVHLNIDEMERLEKFFPPMITLSKAKDMFLFQCYTGLAYADLVSVREGNIFKYKRKFYISKYRNKTDVEALIPYTEKARLIFEKHNYNLKLLSNAKYNEALKDVASYLSFAKNLTTHVGRKSFAMAMINVYGYSLESVSKMLGHKSIRTTEMYYIKKTIELIHNAVIDQENRVEVRQRA